MLQIFIWLLTSTKQRQVVLNWKQKFMLVKMCTIFLVLLIYFILKNHVNSQYIIDTNSLIVIQNVPEEQRDSRENNLFGYSMAFMKGEFGATTFAGDNSTFYGTIFIGAPKQTHSTKNSGVIWTCKFGNMGSVDCSILSQISNQTQPNFSKPNSLYYPGPESNQWIGASLSTTKDYLFACAPRWKLNGFVGKSCHPETSMPGACYMINSTTGNPTVLGPFYEQEKTELYSQFGFSSHATRSNNIVVGVRGSSSGLSGIRAMKDSRSVCMGTYMEYLPQIESGAMLVRDRDSKCHTYFGYSITSGRIKGGGEFVAVGAPRGENLFGYVLINRFQSSNDNIRVKGEQIGAYFGYSLATLDLNGDGDDELIIGAPHFTLEFNTEYGYNGGCIFVYDIDLVSQTQNQINRLCLDLDQEPKGARFGSAIASLGDINFDHKDDFVVAAPYHQDGVGTIFIYYGSIPLSTTPAQIIRGKSLNIPNLRGFGTFLLGNDIDVDGNATPDLAVSSFESNQVVILRSHPVAKAILMVTYHSIGSVGSSGKIYRFQLSPWRNDVRLRVRICISFTFSVNLRRNDVGMESTVKYELSGGVYFDDGIGHKVNHLLNVTQTTCLERKLRLSNSPRPIENLNDIRFRASLSYTAPSSLRVTALLNLAEQQTANRTFYEAFQKFNPFVPASIPITYSDWEHLEIANDNCESDGIPGCNPELKLKVDMHFRDGEDKPLPINTSFVVGQVETLVLLITLWNNGETAYGPKVKVSLNFNDDFEIPNTKWMWWLNEFSGRKEHFQNSPVMNDNSIVGDFLEHSRSLQNQTHSVYELRITNLRQLKVKESSTGELMVKVEAFPTEQPEEKVEKVMNVSLEVKVNLHIQPDTLSTEQSKIDLAVNPVDLTQIFFLINDGNSSITKGYVRAEIYVPTHVSCKNSATQVIGIVNPSYYNTEIQCEAHDFTFYKPSVGRDQNLDTTETKQSDSSSSPPPLQLRTEPDKSAEISTHYDQLVTLSAVRVTSRCRKITCFTDLPSMEPRPILLHMYALTDASTCLNFEKTIGIRIKTSISVYYLKTKVKRNEGSTSRLFLVGIRFEAWMIFVGGMSGGIIFLLVSCILSKCGFFQRDKQTELQTLKRQTQLELQNF